MDKDTIIIVTAILANIATTVGGVMAMVSRLEETSRWRGWADTKIKTHCSNIRVLFSRTDDHEKRLSRHEGKEASGNG